MSTGCAIQMINEVNALESGAEAWPIFFSGPNCDISQWPPPGEQLSPSFINTRFPMRDQVCRADDGNPFYLYTPNGSYDSNVVNIGKCPMPGIRSIILPTKFQVTFEASNDGNISAHIQDTGIFVLGGIGTQITNTNFWIINTDRSQPQWGSSTLGPEATKTITDDTTKEQKVVKNCNFDANSFVFANIPRPGWDTTGKLQNSNLACGQPFWPFFTAIEFNGPTGYRQDSNGQNWLLSYTDTDGTARNLGSYCTSDFGNYGGSPTFQFTPGYTVYNQPDTQIGNAGYSSGDCGQDAPVFFSGTDGGGYSCFGERNNPFTCTGLQMNGNLQYVTIKPLYDDWTFQQFQYCIGLDTLTIGGIGIQRYGNGTPACDVIVPTFCRSTAWSTASPFIAKACACLIEQEKINLQFTGLDLPVQCFSDICSNNDPNVYRTSEQQAGCSARICTQIISINGSAISSEGYQEILCNGQVYDVETINPSVTPVPTVTPNFNNSVQLGTVFYIALGLLVVMVLLLVAWAIRKAVLQRRSQTRDRNAITSALQQIINT